MVSEVCLFIIGDAQCVPRVSWSRKDISGHLAISASSACQKTTLTEAERTALYRSCFCHGGYILSPVLVGLNYTVLKLPDMSVWAEAGVGANFRRIPQYLVTFPYGGEMEVVTLHHLGSTATWKAGVGVTFAEEISLELSYSAFCSSEVKGRIFAKKGNVIGDWTHKLVEGIVAGKRNHSMLFLCVGIHF